MNSRTDDVNKQIEGLAAYLRKLEQRLPVMRQEYEALGLAIGKIAQIIELNQPLLDSYNEAEDAQGGLAEFTETGPEATPDFPLTKNSLEYAHKQVDYKAAQDRELLFDKYSSEKLPSSDLDAGILRIEQKRKYYHTMLNKHGLDWRDVLKQRATKGHKMRKKLRAKGTKAS